MRSAVSDWIKHRSTGTISSLRGLRTKEAQQAAALRSQAHQTAAAYLEKYPKEKELSKLYMISLPN